MKRGFRSIYLILIASLYIGLNAQQAKSDEHWWGSYYTPGNFLIDFYSSYDPSDSLFEDGNPDTTVIWGNAEFLISKIFVNDVMPIDFGLHATGIAGFDLTSFEENVLGAGGGISAHIGFRGFGGRFGDMLEKIDVYSNLGAGYTFMFSDGDVETWTGMDDIPMVLYSSIGVAYYLTDTTAVTVGNSNWGSHSGISFGLRIKSGPKQTIGTRPEPQPVEKSSSVAIASAKKAQTDNEANKDNAIIHEQLSDGEAEFYLQLFRNLYGGTFSHGGFLIDDYNFIEGEGTVFTVKIYDEESDAYKELEIQKALIERGIDTSTWSYTLDLEDKGQIIYELTLDEQDLLQSLAIIQSNNVSTYVPDYPMQWNNAIILYQDDFDQYKIASEKRTITSGTFSCDRLFYDAGEYKYTWWVSDDIPGYIVDFTVEQDGFELIRANLKEISLKNTSIIGD